jgi:hypothetical protein
MLGEFPYKKKACSYFNSMSQFFFSLLEKNISYKYRKKRRKKEREKRCTTRKKKKIINNKIVHEEGV